MKRLTTLILDNSTPPQFLPKLLSALTVQGENRMLILEDIVPDLANTPLPKAVSDDILQVLRTEYQLAKAHGVLSDQAGESQSPTGAQAWKNPTPNPPMTTSAIQNLLKVGLISPGQAAQMLAELINTKVNPPILPPGPPFSPKPQWTLDPVTGYPKKV